MSRRIQNQRVPPLNKVTVPFCGGRVSPWMAAWMAAVGLLLLGCATIDDLSVESYRAVGLSGATLKTQTIGLLPMFGKGENRIYLGPADQIFVDVLKRHRPDRIVMPPEETIRLIRERGLEATYQSIAKSYSAARAPEEAPLKELGQALGTRYLLLTELQGIEIAEGATQVRLRARLWDTERGDTLWEGIGEGRGYVFFIFPWTPSSIEKTLAVASRGLSLRLP